MPWRRLLLVVSLSWFLQAGLAIAMAPFLQLSQTGIYPCHTILVSSKSQDAWRFQNSSELEPVLWVPKKQVSLVLYWVMWPPSTAFLSGIDSGWYNDVQYWGKYDPSKDYTQDSWLSTATTVTFSSESVTSRNIDHDEMKKNRYYRYVEKATGWPLPSMYGSVNYRLGTEPDPNGGGLPWEAPRYEWALPVPEIAALSASFKAAHLYALPDEFLPFRPLLVGSLVNTGVFSLFSTAIWLFFRRLWRLVSGAKKRERIARGECIRCGYPLGDMDQCPECGPRLSRRRRSLDHKTPQP